MNTTVIIEVIKEDYIKVMTIINEYCTKSGISILSRGATDEIVFKCNKFRLYMLKHDMQLAKNMGLRTKLEVF